MSPPPPEPLPPGSTIGVLGGGQLGRMLCKAAARLGFQSIVLTPEIDSPAAQVASRTLTAAYDDADALAELGGLADVVTFEFENVPVQPLRNVLEAAGHRVRPSTRALQVAQDRAEEKAFLRSAGVRVADYAVIDTAPDIDAALDRLGAPALLKTRREGYDGKGQAWVRGAGEGRSALATLGRRPCVLEAEVEFRRELSVISARGPDGEVAMFPLSENRHEAGILRRTIAPAEASPGTVQAAAEIARRVLEALDYVGVLTVELFELADGALLVNEIAPRVHNSGHWTLDACATDQFQQHLRAVAGWPLGSTAPIARAEMVNLIGDEVERWREFAADPDARLHLYGKTQARPGRKMGHVTRISPL